MPRGALSFRFIPWKPMDFKPVEDEVFKALGREGDIVRRMYESTTRTWTHKPRFWKTVGHAHAIAGVRVYTDDPIYTYVDYGTKPHVIRARRARFLSFRWPSKAKTTPRVIGSHQGSVGDNWARKREVHHPGTKAREFTPEILKRRQQYFPAAMQAAIDTGLRRARR